MADTLLLLAGIILVISGLIGCILPVLPGPPLSFIGLLLLHFTRYAEFSVEFLFLWGTVAVFVTLIDYVIPVWGTKRFGGTKFGVWGATIGLVIGIFIFPPIGIIIGPFVGAVIAESVNGSSFENSLKAGLGSLLGFLFGIGLKLIASIAMTFYFFKELF